MNNTLRKCRECGEKLIGRSDKKFCTDMCRNAYNNRIRSENNAIVRVIHSKLNKNRLILGKLLTKEVTKVSRIRLEENGFHFGYCTSWYTTRKGETYFFTYEYGYVELANGYYCLVKKKGGKN